MRFRYWFAALAIISLATAQGALATPAVYQNKGTITATGYTAVWSGISGTVQSCAIQNQGQHPMFLYFPSPGLPAPTLDQGMQILPGQVISCGLSITVVPSIAGTNNENFVYVVVTGP